MTDTKKSRFTEEQISGFIKQAEAGVPIKELCRKGGFSDATFYKWRAKFGGMDVPDAKRLRELESENAKLTKLLARGAPGHPCAQGHLRGKALAPQAKRTAMTGIVEQYHLSERRACRRVGPRFFVLCRDQYRLTAAQVLPLSSSSQSARPRPENSLQTPQGYWARQFHLAIRASFEPLAWPGLCSEHRQLA